MSGLWQQVTAIALKDQRIQTQKSNYLLARWRWILLFLRDSGAWESQHLLCSIMHKCEQKMYQCFISTFKVWAVNTKNTAYLSVSYKITFWRATTKQICKYTEQFDFHTAHIVPFSVPCSCLFMHFFSSSSQKGWIWFQCSPIPILLVKSQFRFQYLLERIKEHTFQEQDQPLLFLQN